MKSIFLIFAALLTALTLSACSSTQRGAGVGAIAGGVIGGVTTGTIQGAAVGAAVGTVGGAVAGTMIGRYRDDPDQCVYEDRRGRRFVDDCPEG
jgi:predicted small secreted protein